MHIIETSEQKVLELREKQQIFFETGNTRDIRFRIDKLKKLKAAIIKYEQKIADALWQDLHKSFEEAYLTEISIVMQEINLHIKRLKKWAAPQRVKTPLHLFPSSSKIVYEPLGLALIIAPWNYPFQLVFNPLVGAISAGNCALLKPSPSSAYTAKVMEELVNEVFDENYVTLVHGEKEINTFLLKQKFDLIFFTGSSAVGKVVMRAAAEHLTPVILELGGKSPCIIDKDANLNRAAKRIAWGKTINAGQTCIAPDYLMVHKSVKEALIEKLKTAFDSLYGTDIKNSRFYPRIISDAAFERLTYFINKGSILYGGQYNKAEKFIAPTLLDCPNSDERVMQEEIFGPILPILTWEEPKEVHAFINKREKPLALYYFGTKHAAHKIIAKTSAGGSCINDTILHIANHNMPFGGVGNSGLGAYHGKESFLAFSNQRAVVSTPNWIDLPFRYPPFKMFNLIKKIV